jgi:hypothetical protein
VARQLARLEGLTFNQLVVALPSKDYKRILTTKDLDMTEKVQGIVFSQKDLWSGGGFNWRRSVKVYRKGELIAHLKGWYCTYVGDTPCPETVIEPGVARPGDSVVISTPSLEMAGVVGSPSTRVHYTKAVPSMSLEKRLAWFKFDKRERERRTNELHRKCLQSLLEETRKNTRERITLR